MFKIGQNVLCVSDNWITRPCECGTCNDKEHPKRDKVYTVEAVTKEGIVLYGHSYLECNGEPASYHRDAFMKLGEGFAEEVLQSIELQQLEHEIIELQNQKRGNQF